MRAQWSISPTAAPGAPIGRGRCAVASSNRPRAVVSSRPRCSPTPDTVRCTIETPGLAGSGRLPAFREHQPHLGTLVNPVFGSMSAKGGLQRRRPRQISGLFAKNRYLGQYRKLAGLLALTPRFSSRDPGSTSRLGVINWNQAHASTRSSDRCISARAQVSGRRGEWSNRRPTPRRYLLD
jgi:hypothetical protein